MGSTFNPQILVEKLTKLNSSQASIETLSHWCIFHMNKAKQVVEMWGRQFHSAPREQRLAFLYLANDILQNSRRKGSDFVGEFWKVLPEALHDVIRNGDEFGKNSAMRLINIWEERKVFGSRGQTLKEEILGRHTETGNKNGKDLGVKMKQAVASSTVDKIVSGYQSVNGGGQIDEDDVSSRCRASMIFLEKAEREIDGDSNSEKLQDPAFVEELHGQNSILRTCIDQLTIVESSRTRLVSLLREALQEQELKLDQTRNLLQAARSKSEQMTKVCPPLLNGNNNKQMMSEQTTKDAVFPIYTPLESGREQSAPVMYTRHLQEEDPRKSAAAAVAAKLTASSSSAQMLSYVLSSLASGHHDSSPDKKPKLEPPPPPPPDPEQPPPPPPSSPPPQQPLPPLPLMASYAMLPPLPFMPPPGQFNYMMTQQLQRQPPLYSMLPPPSQHVLSSLPPPNGSGSKGNLYSHPMARISR